MLIAFILLYIRGGGTAIGEENVSDKFTTDERANISGTVNQPAEEINIMQGLYPAEGYRESMNGIDYSWNDGVCTANGESSGYSQLKLYLNKESLPEGMIAGHTYKVYSTSSDENLAFSIVFYANQEIIKQHYFTNDSLFVVPVEAEGCLIRFWTNKDKRINGTVSAKVIYSESSNAGTKTASNTYVTEHYSNTYNIECTPMITADNRYFLKSPGNGTDSTADIQSMLNTVGYCQLGPGDYYVTGIEIPNYGMLAGSGYSTRLILDPCVDIGYAIKLKNYGSIKDLQIVGSIDDINPEENIGRRNGILFEGMADSQETQVTYYRSTIENCLIRNFSGGGITCYNTGLSPSSHLVVSDVRTIQCGAGINISYYSEYHRFTNVCASACYYGCIDNGGNNIFSNCDFSENKLGLLIDNSNGQSRNNSHGTFDACSFNHSDKNEGTAIRILGASTGEVFTGCQIFFGKIDIRDSVGIRFNACNLGRQVPISIVNSTTCIFSDCTMYSNEESPLDQENNTTLRFDNCYLRDGNVYDPIN